MNNPSQYDAIVIGAGLAGLCCAVGLLRSGLSVCVLEQGKVVGGAFQSFERAGVSLDTGFHYVGGAGKGEMMYPLLRYYGIADLPWVRLDDNCFNQLHVEGKTFRLGCGFDHFERQLIEAFPSEEQGIKAYVDVMRHVARHVLDSLNPAWNVIDNTLFTTSAYDFLCEKIETPLLREVLCACASNTELTETLPLYSFAQSMTSYLQGAYRLCGGGQVLMDALARQVLQMGGAICLGQQVRQIEVDEHRATSVVCDEQRYDTSLIISTIHPSRTMSLLPDGAVRRSYRSRMVALPNSRGMFTVQLVVKPGRIAYKPYVESVHKGDLWHLHCGTNDAVQQLFINYAATDVADGYVRNIDLLTPMEWDAVKEWSDSKVGHRATGYRQLKQSKAEECIAVAEQYVEGLRDAIEHVYVSTPLTYRDYTGTVEGSAFGVRKSCNSLLTTILSPQTPIENLYLSGQSMTLHGMLGTMMSATRSWCMAIDKDASQEIVPFI